MKISVITPTLNRAKVISAAIDSVLSQTHADTELIVVDGLSSDGSQEILNGYGTRIRWISEKDSGTSDAINKGLRMATGDFITLLNSDDRFADPQVVENAVRDLSLQPDVDILCGDVKVMHPTTGRILYRVPNEPDKLYWRSLNILGAFFRRSLFEERGFDLSYKVANDQELYAWLIRVKGAKVLSVPRVQVLFSLGGMCNDVRNAYVIAKERFRLRSKYYGPIGAALIFVFAYSLSALRNSGFRPQYWLRNLAERWNAVRAD